MPPWRRRVPLHEHDGSQTEGDHQQRRHDGPARTFRDSLLRGVVLLDPRRLGGACHATLQGRATAWATVRCGRTSPIAAETDPVCHRGSASGGAYGLASPCGAGSSTRRRPSGSRGSGSSSSSGSRTNARSCIRGCGTVRSGSSIDPVVEHEDVDVDRARTPPLVADAAQLRLRPRGRPRAASCGSRSAVDLQHGVEEVRLVARPPTGAVSHTRDDANARTPAFREQVDGALQVRQPVAEVRRRAPGTPAATRLLARPRWRPRRRRRCRAAGGVRLVHDGGRARRRGPSRAPRRRSRPRSTRSGRTTAARRSSRTRLGDAAVVGGAPRSRRSSTPTSRSRSTTNGCGASFSPGLAPWRPSRGSRTGTACALMRSVPPPRPRSTTVLGVVLVSARSTQAAGRSSWIITAPGRSPCPCGARRYRARRYS